MVFKKSLKLILFLIPFSSNIIVVAQTDSLHIQIDTVIVKAPPVVIKKTIYLPENSTPNKKKWHIGVECNMGNTIGSNKSKKPNVYATSMAIYAEKEMHHIFFNLGIGFMTINETQTYQTVAHTNTHHNTTIPDTIDIYTQENKPVYIIQNKTITKTYSTEKDTIIQQNLSTRYLQFASIIGYNITLWRINLSAFTGFKPSFLYSTKQNPSTQISNSIQPFLSYIPLGLRISYNISNSFNIATNLHYLINLQSPNEKNIEKNNLQNIGIGINYMF
jgi:hypothetical protein